MPDVKEVGTVPKSETRCGNHGQVAIRKQHVWLRSESLLELVEHPSEGATVLALLHPVRV